VEDPDEARTRTTDSHSSAAVVIRTTGSLRAALEQLGYEAAWTPVADDDILTALRAWTIEHGRAPTCPAWRQSHGRPAPPRSSAATAPGTPQSEREL
jgi:hypothetical protein